MASQLLTATCYTGGILWVCLVCGARLYSGASSPADVQGGMLVGGVLVRVWLPICEYVNDFLVARPLIFGLPQWLFLGCVASFLMLIHPFTPGEPRSWIAFAFSVKAVAFGYAFIVGSNLCARLQCAADVLGPAGTFSGAMSATAASLGFHLRCHNGLDSSGLLTQAECVALHQPADPSIGTYGYGWVCTSPHPWAGGSDNLACNHHGSNTMNYMITWLGFGVASAMCSSGSGAT